MKKLALALIMFSSLLSLQAQEISSRAKAMRMMNFANPEYMVKDIKMQWYREVGYKNYYDSMSVSVNTLRRLDDSYLDMYRSITTGRVEMIAGKITDPEVKLDNGVHVGMSKEDVFKVVFKRFPKSYVADIAVLKVISGAGEVGEIYTFRGNKLRHIGIISKYKYY